MNYGHFNHLMKVVFLLVKLPPTLPFITDRYFVVKGFEAM